jgi:predicted dehydrogenase
MPFTINAEESEEVIKKKLFLMEAMRSRFFPIMKKVNTGLAEGVIGDLRMVT